MMDRGRAGVPLGYIPHRDAGAAHNLTIRAIFSGFPVIHRIRARATPAASVSRNTSRHSAVYVNCMHCAIILNVACSLFDFPP